MIGKTQFAKSLFGPLATLVVQCQGKGDALPDLRHFRRNVHKCIIFDEVRPEQVLANKALLQAAVEPVQMAQSQCGAFRYNIWVYGVAFILCSNAFPLEANESLNEPDAEWLRKNITLAELPKGEKWFVPSPTGQAEATTP